MSGFADVHNGGAYARSARATGNQTATAGGAGDAVAVNTDFVSRKASQGLLGIANSAKLILSYTSTLAAGATLKFGVQFRDAVDAAGTGAALYGEAVTVTSLAGPTGGGVRSDTAEVDIDLGGAREFVSAVVTPDLSAANTDTTAWSAIYLFFGQQRGFITKSPANLASADLI